MEKNESSQFLKRELWFLASVSLLSLLLCYILGFFFFEPLSFHVYLSTFAFSFLTRTIDTKYMFLVCNGILVFLATSSTSITSSSSVDKEEELVEGGDLSLYDENEDFIGGDENSCVVTNVMDATDEEELLSTDELNNKFEEFIRKMKEEIRIESQQQLVAV